MPVLSMFYGIIVSMYFVDNRRHHRPHIHVARLGPRCSKALRSRIAKQSERGASASDAVLPAWIEIHGDELMADWALATRGRQVFKIDALR